MRNHDRGCSYVVFFIRHDHYLASILVSDGKDLQSRFHHSLHDKTQVVWYYSYLSVQSAEDLIAGAFDVCCSWLGSFRTKPSIFAENVDRSLTGDYCLRRNSFRCQIHWVVVTCPQTNFKIQGPRLSIGWARHFSPRGDTYIFRVHNWGLSSYL